MPSPAPSSTPPRHTRSLELLRRARERIAGGYHLSGRPLVTPETTPMYIERGQGCRCWDVDGHEYIDYFMAFGPHLLGYANAEVDDAAIAQLRRGTPLSMNHPLHLTFIERLIGRFPGAEMGAFFKTGSEATTAALRIARRATGRRRVVRCGYHGWHDWCLPLEGFVPGGLAEQVLELRASEPGRLHDLFTAHPDDIAAVIVAPEMFHPPDPDVFAELARVTRQHGAVFILDEVKTAFRIKPGSMQQYLGLIPDLTTVSKALGNGWPVAAVLGKREVLRHADDMHLSATYHGDTAAMAAALATLDILDREDVVGHVWRLGERLIDGLDAAARMHGLPARAYGEPLPPMPFMRFVHADPAVNADLTATFYTEAIAQGILLHPRHLWFISHAHQEADIDRTLVVARAAMARARELHGDRL